jgi:Domain of unknown function (DUF5655)
MARWVCPRCDREFDRPHQAHTCVPGVTVDAVLKPGYRAVYDAILDHLSTLGPLHEDAVSVGVFLKRQTKFAEVRPMARALSLDLVLPATINSPRVTRTITISAGRIVHVIRLTAVSDVDDELKDWLTTAYLAA